MITWGMAIGEPSHSTVELLYGKLAANSARRSEDVLDMTIMTKSLGFACIKQAMFWNRGSKQGISDPGASGICHTL